LLPILRICVTIQRIKLYIYIYIFTCTLHIDSVFKIDYAIFIMENELNVIRNFR